MFSLQSVCRDLLGGVDALIGGNFFDVTAVLGGGDILGAGDDLGGGGVLGVGIQMEEPFWVVESFLMAETF